MFDQVGTHFTAAGNNVDDTVGRPAAAAASANHSASNGVSGAGLITTVQPAISAGMSFGMIRNCGTFQGTIAPTTPTGCFDTSDVPPNMPARDSSTGALVIRSL
jgi:hypothetical protein